MSDENRPEKMLDRIDMAWGDPWKPNKEYPRLGVGTPKAGNSI